MTNERWTIKKEISLGDTLAIVTACVAVIYSWSTLDKRVSILETDAVRQARVDVRQDDDMQNIKRDIREDLRAINEKLDRMIQRRDRN